MDLAELLVLECKMVPVYSSTIAQPPPDNRPKLQHEKYDHARSCTNRVVFVLFGWYSGTCMIRHPGEPGKFVESQSYRFIH